MTSEDIFEGYIDKLIIGVFYQTESWRDDVYNKMRNYYTNRFNCVTGKNFIEVHSGKNLYIKFICFNEGFCNCRIDRAIIEESIDRDKFYDLCGPVFIRNDYFRGVGCGKILFEEL